MSNDHWQQAQAIFERALERPASERTTFVQEICGEDRALLTDILSLLNANEKADHLFRDIAESITAPSSPNQLAQHVGPFKILESLGSGGMGVVFKALDTRLDRHVALKFLSPELSRSQAARERLFQEAKTVSALDHPNLCTLYDLGEADNGQMFLAMAYYAGQTLAERLRLGQLSCEDALDVLVQTTCGLEYAHQRGIVHRDIKPSNLFVTTQGVVKIIDFGIAKVPWSELTRSGDTLGTLMYSSPEQLDGAGVDHRTDIWSLGAVMLEALNARPPFSAGTPKALIDAIMRAQHEPLGPGFGALTDGINAVLARTLRTEQSDRFSSMSHLRAALMELESASTDRVPPSSRRSGIAMSQLGPAPIALTTTATARDSEIRPVVVLMADLVSDDSEMALDPEGWHAISEGFAKRTNAMLSALGASIQQQQGDAITAVFGAPIAHDNDSERAVIAAIRVHDASLAVAAECGVRAHARVGIASGPVIAPNAASAMSNLTTMSGGPFKAAVFLNQMAAPGQTLMAQSVRDAGHRFIEACELNHVTPDGQRVWQFERLVPATQPLQGALVARQTELTQFRGIVERLRSDRVGQVVFIRGDPGIGKTRLADELLRLGESAGLQCISARVYDFGVAASADAITTLARGLLGITEHATSKELDAASGVVSIDPQSSPGEAALLFALVRVALSSEHKRLLDAMSNAARQQGMARIMRSVIRARAATSPLMLRVEDVHWADQHTLDSLASIGDETSARPVVLILTSRREGKPPEFFASENRLTRIDLTALREQEARELAGAFSHRDSAFVETCVARAQGNPLFLEQLLRCEGASDQAMPTSIHTLVLARLDRLDGLDRIALQTASVIGQRFSLTQLRALMAQPDYDVQSLADRHLVRPDADQFIFAHALIRDGVYSSLPKTTQRELHQRAAQLLGRDDLVLRAEHLERAADPSAATAYLEASRAQAVQFQFEQALRLCDQGITLTRATQKWYEHGLHKAELEQLLGHTDASIKTTKEIIDEASDPKVLCRAHIELAAGYNILDQHVEALAALDTADCYAAQTGDEFDLARLNYLRGSIRFPLGDIDGCRAAHESSLRHAQKASDPLLEAKALSGLGDAQYARGRMLSAYGYFSRCMALCETHGFGQVEAANRFMVGTVRIYLNETDAALDDSLNSAHAARRVGHTRAEIVSRLTAGWVYLALEDMVQAREEAECALSLARQLGTRRFEPFINESIARIHLHAGEVDEAGVILDEALIVCRETGLHFIGPWLLGTKALASTSDADCLSALTEGEKLLSGGCVGHNYFRFYQSAMEASLSRARWLDARRFCDALEQYTQAEPAPWSDFYVAWGRALADAGEELHPQRTRVALTALKEQALTSRLLCAIPRIDAALAKLKA